MVVFQTAQSGGHRTLLYGHAILLRHSFSGMVRQPSSDQFDAEAWFCHWIENNKVIATLSHNSEKNGQI